MNALEIIRKEWEACSAGLDDNPFFARMREGTFTREHYAMFLREEYYNTGENPESFAMLTFHLPPAKRALNRNMLRHALAETGHNHMALDDLKALGYSVDGMAEGRALPTTEAFLAFSVLQIQHRDPLAYLAYLYHLEAIALAKGPMVCQYLRGFGVPPEALTFLMEHVTVDVTHAKWNDGYLKELIREPRDLDAMIYGLRGTVRLHGLMLEGIVEAVDRGDPAWLALRSCARTLETA